MEERNSAIYDIQRVESYTVENIDTFNSSSNSFPYDSSPIYATTLPPALLSSLPGAQMFSNPPTFFPPSSLTLNP